MDQTARSPYSQWPVAHPSPGTGRAIGWPAPPYAAQWWTTIKWVTGKNLPIRTLKKRRRRRSDECVYFRDVPIMMRRSHWLMTRWARSTTLFSSGWPNDIVSFRMKTTDQSFHFSSYRSSEAKMDPYLVLDILHILQQGNKAVCQWIPAPQMPFRCRINPCSSDIRLCKRIHEVQQVFRRLTQPAFGRFIKCPD